MRRWPHIFLFFGIQVMIYEMMLTALFYTSSSESRRLQSRRPTADRQTDRQTEQEKRECDEPKGYDLVVNRGFFEASPFHRFFFSFEPFGIFFYCCSCTRLTLLEDMRKYSAGSAWFCKQRGK